MKIYPLKIQQSRFSQVVGAQYDKQNFLLMHAIGPNVAGVIGTAVCAGHLISRLDVGC